MCNCHEIRGELKRALRRGDVGSAARAATKGATEMAAHALKRISRPPPPIVRRPIARIR